MKIAISTGGGDAPGLNSVIRSATLSALRAAGIYNLDEFRDAVERMPVQEYLAASYYERWFHAIETLLVEKGVLTEEEVHGG